MASELIASDGDEVTIGDAHIPPAGAGTYPITPATDQLFVYLNNKLVIISGQVFSAHCDAVCLGSTSLLYINGGMVYRDGNSIISLHPNSGCDVINQSFVYSE